MACSLCAKSPLGLTFFPGRTATGYATVQIGNETVTATLEHPFWVENVGWVGAGALQPGEWVKTLDGGDQAVVSVQTFAGEIKVYNFEVENTHAYFVSGAGLLVHNQSSVRSINQTNQAIQKGQAPKGVTRADISCGFVNQSKRSY